MLEKFESTCLLCSLNHICDKDGLYSRTGIVCSSLANTFLSDANYQGSTDQTSINDSSNRQIADDRTK